MAANQFDPFNSAGIMAAQNAAGIRRGEEQQALAQKGVIDNLLARKKAEEDYASQERNIAGIIANTLAGRHGQVTPEFQLGQGLNRQSADEASKINKADVISSIIKQRLEGNKLGAEAGLRFKADPNQTAEQYAMDPQGVIRNTIPLRTGAAAIGNPGLSTTVGETVLGPKGKIQTVKTKRQGGVADDILRDARLEDPSEKRASRAPTPGVNMNQTDLKDHPAYQQWIADGGHKGGGVWVKDAGSGKPKYIHPDGKSATKANDDKVVVVKRGG